MSEQTYEVNLRNFQGGILNTFRGTPEQILAQMEKQLDLANYAIWSPIIKEMFKGQKIDPGFMQVDLLERPDPPFREDQACQGFSCGAAPLGCSDPHYCPRK